MIMIQKWRVSMGKDGIPILVYWDDIYLCYRKAYPKSEDITVMEDGIRFSQTHRGEVTHYVCPYKNLFYDKGLALVDNLIKYNFIESVQMHVLSFLYELVSGVFHERCPALVKSEPLDINALLAKYSELNERIGSIDWKKVVEVI